jgi:Na+-transporting NADH:ubiquinone oxidoreductase subunit NqrC
MVSKFSIKSSADSTLSFILMVVLCLTLIITILQQALKDKEKKNKIMSREIVARRGVHDQAEAKEEILFLNKKVQIKNKEISQYKEYHTKKEEDMEGTIVVQEWSAHVINVERKGIEHLNVLMKIDQ